MADANTERAALDIPLAAVEGSTRVAAHGYDEDSKTLAVQFKGAKGTVCHYYGVEPEVYDAFTKADSLGRFLGANIAGQYEFATNPNGDSSTAA